ncbi:MAG: hypothetical protein HY401_01875 [Elusimicrobia bacterium]|nr:hypothetical protein [Elusimicrobiota bacterium]
MFQDSTLQNKQIKALAMIVALTSSVVDQTMAEISDKQVVVIAARVGENLGEGHLKTEIEYLPVSPRANFGPGRTDATIPVSVAQKPRVSLLNRTTKAIKSLFPSDSDFSSIGPKKVSSKEEYRGLMSGTMLDGALGLYLGFLGGVVAASATGMAVGRIGLPIGAAFLPIALGMPLAAAWTVYGVGRLGVFRRTGGLVGRGIYKTNQRLNIY